MIVCWGGERGEGWKGKGMRVMAKSEICNLMGDKALFFSFFFVQGVNTEENG